MTSHVHLADPTAPRDATTIFRKIWATWKRVGQFLGDWIARVALTLFYFTLFVPFAMGTRLFGDPLDIRANANRSHWLVRTASELTLDHARRQF
jgi:hypothetical protein